MCIRDRSYMTRSLPCWAVRCYRSQDTVSSHLYSTLCYSREYRLQDSVRPPATDGLYVIQRSRSALRDGWSAVGRPSDSMHNSPEPGRSEGSNVRVPVRGRLHRGEVAMGPGRD